MFPIGITRIPKYLESWIVSVVDKEVALEEKSFSFKTAAVRMMNFVLIIFLSYLGK